ncbi:hypothetical protein LINPERPRIM_LOCUS8101 [Linum perenne]
MAESNGLRNYLDILENDQQDVMDDNHRMRDDISTLENDKQELMDESDVLSNYVVWLENDQQDHIADNQRIRIDLRSLENDKQDLMSEIERWVKAKPMCLWVSTFEGAPSEMSEFESLADSVRCDYKFETDNEALQLLLH